MPLKRSLFVVAFATLPTLAAFSADPVPLSVEERLRILEQQVESLARENQALRKELQKPAPAAAPSLVQPGGHETKISVGGFLQAQAEFGAASDPRWSGVKDRFFFRRARVYLAGVVDDFDFKAELDLQGNTLGAATGQLARANEIFINWHRYAAANIRFGQLKPAFGGEALLSDGKMLTIERALSNDRLTDGRQLALAMAGDLFEKKLSYYALVANGNGSNVSANDNSKFQRSLRLIATPYSTANDKLTVAVDGLWTTDTGLGKSDLGLTGNSFTGSRDMWGIDGSWIHGPFELAGELLHGTFKPTNAVPSAKFEAEGWELTAAYFLVPAKLQAVLRREEFDPNTAIGGNTIRTTTFGFNYYIKGDDLKLMVDYLDGSVPGSTTDGGRFITRFQIVY
jgi:phosphate-selective porin